MQPASQNNEYMEMHVCLVGNDGRQSFGRFISLKMISIYHTIAFLITDTEAEAAVTSDPET